MIIRNSNLGDINAIIAIYDYAVEYMQKNNNPNQWRKGYPGSKIIKEDIEAKKSYLYVKNEQLLGVFYFAIEEEPVYKNIFNGSWINEDPYGVIHRVATIKNKNGVAGSCVDYCYDKCRNIRIDTHKDNIPMQKFLIKKGFVKCGIIYLDDTSERIAYQKYE